MFNALVDLGQHAAGEIVRPALVVSRLLEEEGRQSSGINTDLGQDVERQLLRSAAKAVALDQGYSEVLEVIASEPEMVDVFDRVRLATLACAGDDEDRPRPGSFSFPVQSQ